MTDYSASHSMKAKHFWFFCLYLGVSYPLHALLDTIYIARESDILLTGDLWTILLGVICHLFLTMILFTAFSVLLVTEFHHSARSNLSYRILIFASFFYKYIVKLFITYAFDGFPTKSSGIATDLVSVLFNLLPELIEYLLVLLLIHTAAKRYRNRMLLEQNCQRHLKSRIVSPSGSVFSYTRYFDYRHPVLKCILQISLVDLVLRLISLILGELHLSIGGGWGPTSWKDWLYILAEVGYEVLVVLMGYLYMSYLVKRLVNAVKISRENE